MMVFNTQFSTAHWRYHRHTPTSQRRRHTPVRIVHLVGPHQITAPPNRGRTPMSSSRSLFPPIVISLHPPIPVPQHSMAMHGHAYPSIHLHLSTTTVRQPCMTMNELVSTLLLPQRQVIRGYHQTNKFTQH